MGYREVLKHLLQHNKDMELGVGSEEDHRDDKRTGASLL